MTECNTITPIDAQAGLRLVSPKSQSFGPIQAQVLRPDIASRTCAQFGVLSPVQAKDRLEHGLEHASGDKARTARAAVLSRIGSIRGINRTEHEALTHLVEVMPVLIDEMGTTVFAPASRNRKIVAEAIGVSASTVGRAWSKLIDKQIIARVYEKRSPISKQRWFQYAINVRKILALPISSKKAFTFSEPKRDPFAGLHKMSRKLYTAVAREPSEMLSHYAKKLKCSKDTVRRVRAELLAVGALEAEAGSTGGAGNANELMAVRKFAPHIWPSTLSDVIDVGDVSASESLLEPRAKRVANPRAKGSQKGSQTHAHFARMSNIPELQSNPPEDRPSQLDEYERGFALAPDDSPTSNVEEPSQSDSPSDPVPIDPADANVISLAGHLWTQTANR